MLIFGVCCGFCGKVVGVFGEIREPGKVWYNGINPSGGMIFLNNHVLGISWHISVEMAHKILPTLYIYYRENIATRDML